MQLTRPVRLGALAAGLGALLVAAGGPLAAAAPLTQAAEVAAVPQAGTPNVLDGTVFAFAQVGTTMVVGGSFTRTASSDPSTPYATPYVMAFDTATGAVRTAFAPQLDGVVQALLPGPTDGTVYVGGQFKTVGGTPAKGLVLLNVADGSRVTGFTAPTMDLANVQTLKRLGGRLFVGGAFTKVGGVAHGGLATLNAGTGALDPYLSSTVQTNHSWTPTSPSTAAKAPVGVSRLDLSPDGTKLVAIGNFKTVDGLSRDQIAMWDLGPTSATVRDWQTDRLVPTCSTQAYDSYVRDVDFSPDGSYFALVATGGYGPDGSLCDSASRWETSASGAGVQPTWVDYTGKDTLLSVAVTGTAVYVGGHERWLNNGLGTDSAGPGAVPRPGLAALDPANGLPQAWNPGRNPRGAGTYTLYATAAGLWIGSDTDYVGNRQYLRGKLAFFPLAGGQPPASTAVPTLPGTVVSGSAGVAPAGAGTVYARVNVGGPGLQSTDSGTDWSADDGASPYRGDGSVVSTYTSPLPAVDGTVPASVPRALFDSERWDPGTKGDGQEMQWHLPVPAGVQVQVRLLFASRYGGTSTPGSRQFDISIDGAVQASSFDIVAAAGQQVGTMRSWTVTSDGTVDIAFTHEVENPVVSGIEIVSAGASALPMSGGTLTSRAVAATPGGLSAGPATPTSAGPVLDPAQVRGATLVGSTLFYGRTDGNLYRRTVGAGSWGPETLVDPYDDPAWATVDNGSGSTYRGQVPGFYAEIPQLTSMTYDGAGQLYYTLYGRSGLFHRAFTPDSGIVGWQELQVPGVTLPDVTGAFLSGGHLYYVTRADGALNAVGLTPTGLAGSPVVVSGPAVDGTDWRSRVLFLAPAPAPAPVIGFRGASTATSTSGTSLQAALPAGLAVGDLLLLEAATTSTTSVPTAPAGWSEVTRSTFAAGTSTAVVWQHSVTASDALTGSVVVQLSGSTRAQVQLLAYSGADRVASSAVATDTALSLTHGSAGASVDTAGSTVVTLWTDKSSTTTAWTPPAGSTPRSSAYGTGSAYLTSLAADDAGAPAGTSPARTGRTDATSRAVVTTLVLHPRS